VRNVHLAIAAPFVLPCIDGRVPGSFGGAEKQLAGIARGLVSRGHRVDVVCLDPGAGTPFEWTGGKVFTTYGERDGIRGVRFFYPRLWSLLSALRRSRAPIVLVRSASSDAGIAALLARALGFRLVLSISSDPNLDGRSEAAMSLRDRLLYRAALRKADCVIVQSVAQERRFETAFGRSRLRRIPSWAEIPASPRSGSAEFFLFAGAIRDAKRPEMFLDAAEAMPDQRFVMMGGPTHDRALFGRIKRRGDSLGNVSFRGFVPPAEVNEAIRRAKALVNTSAFEGFPNAFLEAWAHGVPVVSIAADPDEIICSRALGLHTGSAEALVPALRRIASEPEEAAQMGLKGRDYVAAAHRFEDVISLWEAALLPLSR